MKKSIFKKSVSLILSAIMTLACFFNAYAAKSTKYISDVMTFYADSFEEAKEGLSVLGYEIVENSNLNETLDTGVYLGYKTTTNPNEAITDLATMNMLGNYSYSDYETIIEQQKDQIAEKIDSLTPLISSYQLKCKNGDNAGVICKTVLNKFYEDDNKVYMGDYLLSYDFSDEKKDELSTVFLQSGSYVMLSIINILAFCSGDGENNTILDRMSSTGINGVYEYYLSENNKRSQKALRQLNAELGETLLNIKSGWNDFYSYLVSVEEKISYDESENLIIPEEFEEYYTESDAESYTSLVDDISLYLILLHTTIDEESEMSALDYFKRPYSDDILSDIYLLAYSFNDSQKSLMQFLSIKEIFKCDMYDFSDESLQKNIFDMFDQVEAISVYAGVDRSLFDDGVAFTSEATKHESLTGETWSPLGVSKSDWIVPIAICSTLSIVCAGAFTIMKLYKDYYKDVYAMRYYIAEFDHMSALADTAPGRLLSALDKQQRIVDTSKELTLARERFNHPIGRVLPYVMYAAFVLMIVFLILDVISIVMYFTADDVEEEKIPNHIVTYAGSDDTSSYIYYTVVCNQDGDACDLNNHEAQKTIGWLSLYYTKDKNAGDPIPVEGFTVSKNVETIPENKKGLHMFCEESPVNVTSETYTGKKDSCNGTYVFYDNMNLAVGSTFSFGFEDVSWMFAGLLLGILGSTIVVKRKSKKSTC